MSWLQSQSGRFDQDLGYGEAIVKLLMSTWPALEPGESARGQQTQSM